jgi:hypothetical protein
MPDFSIRIKPKPDGGALFDPNSIAAPNFTGISWNNTTGIPHQIRVNDGSNGGSGFETSSILPGEGSTPLYVVQNTEGQTIPYECVLHQDEVGSIFVSTVVNLNENE